MADTDGAAAPFLTYWQAGYEGADHVTMAARRWT